MSDIEREEFEQAVADKWSDSYKFTRFGDEDYYDEIVEGMWRGWQASREAVGPVEVWLGNGDKLIADIYADDGSYAGIGIFEPENGETAGIGFPDGSIDGQPLDKSNAVVLIRSTKPESLQVMVDELQEAMTRMGYTSHASADNQAVSVPSIMYDGYAVFQEVQHARNSKGLENIKDSALVSDVLDSVVKLIKQEQDDE